MERPVPDELVALSLEMLPPGGPRVCAEVCVQWRRAAQLVERPQDTAKGPPAGRLPTPHRYFITAPALLLWASARFPGLARPAAALLAGSEWRAAEPTECLVWVLSARSPHRPDESLTLQQAEDYARRFLKARRRFRADRKTPGHLPYSAAACEYYSVRAEICGAAWP